MDKKKLVIGVIGADVHAAVSYTHLDVYKRQVYTEGWSAAVFVNQSQSLMQFP